MIEYKGYIGVVEFDPEIDEFHGTVINTNDVITFYGSSVAELRIQMQKSVDTYIEFCLQQGKEPENTFSGKLMIQTNPELHRRVALEAARLHVTMDTYIQEILEKAVAGEQIK
ncbi:MAG TPA: type II toxin-antitoxin system HicB family antitoxin [Thermodesulfovibrionia bacterium]|nr:type II toxin-antitoxin system HicB family antitoxin [Thermodesulfovibrionia bacterium]